MRPKVLLLGNDGSLLDTRRLVLQRNALNVQTVCGLSSLTEIACRDVALVVLCHSLSPAEEQTAIQFVRTASPSSMVHLLLTRNREVHLPEHANVSVANGPQEFLSESLDLIRRWQNGLS
jgi:hypothetical protein